MNKRNKHNEDQVNYGGKIPTPDFFFISREDAYLAAKLDGGGEEPIHHDGSEDDNIVSYKENFKKKIFTA